MKTMITPKCDYDNRISSRGQKPNGNGRWLVARGSLTRTPLPSQTLTRAAATAIQPSQWKFSNSPDGALVTTQPPMLFRKPMLQLAVSQRDSKSFSPGFATKELPWENDTQNSPTPNGV